jgi:hypothetical protein
MIHFVSAVMDDATGDIVSLIVSDMPETDGHAGAGQSHVGIGVIICKPFTHGGKMAREIHTEHIEVVDGQPRFKPSITNVASMVINASNVTEAEIKSAVEEHGESGIHRIVGAWIARRCPVHCKETYGRTFAIGEREKRLVDGQLEKLAMPTAPTSPYSRFEANKVAAVHQRIAADAAWQEMTDAIQGAGE